MTRRGHARFADDAGAYLLGSLDDDERAAFEAHLARCDECREATAELAPAVDALQRSVDPVTPPPELKAALMDAVRAEPRASAPGAGRARRTPRRAAWLDGLRARPGYAAVAASALIAIGVAGGALVASFGDDPGARVIAAQIDRDRQPAASAQLVVPEDGGGAILRARGLQQAPPGRVYAVWVRRGERVVPVSLFAVASDGSAAAAIPESVEGADAVLVTREPEGGSDQPSERPVVSVEIAG